MTEQQSLAGIVPLGDIAAVNTVMLFTLAMRQRECLELVASVTIDCRISCRLRTSFAPGITATHTEIGGERKDLECCEGVEPLILVLLSAFLLIS